MIIEATTPEYRFFIQRRLDWVRLIQVKNQDGTAYDLTDHEVACAVRAPERGLGLLAFANIASVESPAAAGQIKLSLTDTQTTTLTEGTYSYDVVLTYPTAMRRQLLRGEMAIEEVDSYA